MNIVNSGSRYQIYGEDVRTFRELPVATYGVSFNKMSGFFLSERNDLALSESKIYGKNPYRVQKVLQSYKLADRNFGVLLSGPKGIGKTLFVRMLAKEAMKNSLPVIIVSEAIHGIANFLSSIAQDSVVVFDEFEKTFAKVEDWNPQDEMLSLFDGVDGGHKLFVVTCNDLSKISSYMLNRPGRFHYHFDIGVPSQEEVREYLTDVVDPKYAESIDDIVNISGTIDMPYDFLRAIAFELNQGYSLKEVMGDLNITKTDTVKFDMKAYTASGRVFESWAHALNMANSHDHAWVDMYDPTFGKHINVWIMPGLAKLVGGEYIINEQIETPAFDENDFFNLPESQRAAAAKLMNEDKIERIVLKKCYESTVARFLS